MSQYIPVLGERTRNAPLSVRRQRELEAQAIHDGADPQAILASARELGRARSSGNWGGDTAPDDGELPPVGEQSDMYPNFPGSQEEPQSPLGVVSGGTPGGSLDALLASRRKSVEDMYDEAAKQLQASYRGPDTSELLLALGAGLLQPTQGGSFGEVIGNGLQGVLPLLQQRHTSRDALNREMTSIRLNKAKDIGDLEEKYLVAQIKNNGPRKLRSAIDPSTGVVKNLDTGTPLPPPDRVQALLLHKDDPMAVELFDRTYGIGAARDIITQYGGQ